MELFISYVRERKKIIFTFALFILVFLITFALYGLPLGAVAYPALICTLFGGIITTLDYMRVRERHCKLCDMRGLPASVILSFPPADTIEAEDYRELALAFKSEAAEIEETAKKRFADMVDYYTVWAHQIKTPIASMRLNLQNEDTPLSRKLLFDLFRTEQYAEMVLTFLRLDSESSDYVFKEHSLDTVIRSSVKKYAGEFIARKIRLNYKEADRTVVTDDKWLGFVIEQLLSNSLKYTKEGEIKIYMKDSDTLCIEDTGIGISPEDLPRIFEKGYTGLNGRSDKRASGIGLYLCRRICQNIGVNISVSSSLGRGTAAYLYFEQQKTEME